MSLGPPFDQSGLRLQQAVGAVVVLALAGAVGWVLLMSGRTLGRGLTIHVEMATPGPLHVGAKIRLAGREIGEVRALTGAANGRTVDVGAFILRDWVEHVHRNSQIYVATPSVLGEAYLEIGPPEAGAAPGPAIAEGDRVRGEDPPQIDDLLAHSERNLRLILSLLRESRPELEELLKNGDELLSTLSGLPADGGQLTRIRTQFVAALDSATELAHVARDTSAVPRVRVIAGDLSAIAGRAGPELRRLGERLQAAMDRLDQLSAVFSPERRAQLGNALATLRKAAATGEVIVRDVKSLADYVQSGQGSVGAFLADKELFDDLHETHAILKSQPWRLILKPQAEPRKK